MVMTPTDIANIALAEGQTRTQINGFPPIDNSPAAVAAALFYTPKTRALLRAAPWAFCRRQENLTLLRSYEDTPSDPPPQPFRYQYLWPSDCLRFRFLLQHQTVTTSGTPFTSAPQGVVTPAYANTAVPFVEAMDNNSGSPRRTLLTNMSNAMGVYTADLSQKPDMWDPMFLSAETAMLASYFIMQLAGDRALMTTQINVATSVLGSARGMNGNESISNVDHVPDWLMARTRVGLGGYWNNYGNGVGIGQGWDAFSFPNGLTY